MTIIKVIDPEITPRAKWLPLARKQHQGPDMDFRPAFKPQGVQSSCTCFAFANAMEYRLGWLGHPGIELDAKELYSRLATNWDGTLAPGDVLTEILNNGFDGWTIDDPVYETNKFDGAVSCLFKKLPVIVCTQTLGAVDSEGWVQSFMNQGIGHNMCAYKVAFRFPTEDTKNVEWGLWCIDSARPTHRFVAIPERLLAEGVDYYSFKNVVPK